MTLTPIELDDYETQYEEEGQAILKYANHFEW